MPKMKLCAGCAQPLYAVSNDCLLCGRTNTMSTSYGRSFLTRNGAIKLARKEGNERMLIEGINRRDALRLRQEADARVQPGFPSPASAGSPPPSSTGSSQPSTGAPPRPGSQMSWQQAEVKARDWMRLHGWPTAEVTQAGADGGVDVRASGHPGAIAQVKFWQGPVGISEVQRLYACAAAEQARPLFFVAGGYTRAAAEWADRYGVVRFVMPPIIPDNDHARELVAAADEAIAADPAAPPTAEADWTWNTPDPSDGLESFEAFQAQVEAIRGGGPWDDKEEIRRAKADLKDLKNERSLSGSPKLLRRTRETRIMTEAKAALRRPK